MQLALLVLQVEGNLFESGDFRVEKNLIASPSLLPIDLVYTLWGSQLVKKANVVFRDFPDSATKYYCHPFTNGRLTLSFKIYSGLS